jgi:DEAD/DEAH box helicase domain-containing protein
LESEKEALLQLVKSINQRRTLEFLTDEGLLPNYAFPESAVRLSSVIWRKKKAAPPQGSRYETWSYEYQRSPSSALSELAPGADFYASGRRVAIDQVDVSVSEVESWRFCPECNHAQRIDLGDEATACPACHSAGWRDSGQQFRLLKLRQVFANTPDRESRIKDDKDDRQPRFFERQILVELGHQDRTQAWRVDDDKLPFGFEYLERATFRDVNFGEPSGQGTRSTIAGREGMRPGFEICGRCGKVQRSENPEHAFSCPSRKEGSRQEIESCLYLYREFASEALRLLLPMMDLGTTRQLHSFVAALQMGLRELFGGSVDHLRTTVYSDPVPGSTLRKQYLVLFDTVPGGTGYLKQLVTLDPKGEMPLFEALELARRRIEECSCWNDPERDGCYRCLYAYRNSRDLDDTSAQVASDLLRRILGDRTKLTEIAALGDISISGLMDSVLEVRFIEALRYITDPEGHGAKVKPSVVNQKPGYRWILGEAEWVIEPQVTPPAAETGGTPVSIDFVLRPARGGSERRLAIFLDGWEFHRDRIAKDLRQRMAMVAGGHWDVWSFTWADLDEQLSAGAVLDVPDFAVPEPGQLKHTLQRMGLSHLAPLADRAVFEWFAAELRGEGLPWRELANGVLAARMSAAGPADARTWANFVERAAPPVAHTALVAILPRLMSADLGKSHPLFELMAVHDGSEGALLCTLEDAEEHRETIALKLAWQGYLRLFQLLRLAPNCWFMTSSGTADPGDYGVIANLRDGVPEDSAWKELEAIEPPYQVLARRLMAAGVREPEIGMEIPDHQGDTWSEAEMVWEEERVAVTSRAETERVIGWPAAAWVVFYLEEIEEDVTGVMGALQGKES